MINESSDSVQVREGFIVDDQEEEEEEEEAEDDEAVERQKRKRARRDREAEEQLDEDDLDLIGEGTGWDREPAEVRPSPALRVACF